MALISLPLSRSDKTLQDIVYKLVPGLFKSKSRAEQLALELAYCVFSHFTSILLYAPLLPVSVSVFPLLRKWYATTAGTLPLL